MEIKKASVEHLNDCVEALQNSDLGKYYFSKENSARNAVIEGIESGNTYVALENNVCIGFFYYIPNGAFHGFPYLHLIAVDESYRCKGIGKKLMNFFENIIFENSDKVFLVVADFNPRAKKFYESLGYKFIAKIPSLYRKSIDENLMLKTKESFS